MSETPQMFTLPSALMQQVLNYLVSRPYSEVHELIQAILAHNPKKAEDEPADPA